MKYKNIDNIERTINLIKKYTIKTLVGSDEEKHRLLSVQPCYV